MSVGPRIRRGAYGADPALEVDHKRSARQSQRQTLRRLSTERSPHGGSDAPLDPGRRTRSYAKAGVPKPLKQKAAPSQFEGRSHDGQHPASTSRQGCHCLKRGAAGQPAPSFPLWRPKSTSAVAASHVQNHVFGGLYVGRTAVAACARSGDPALGQWRVGPASTTRRVRRDLIVGNPTPGRGFAHHSTYSCARETSA